MFTSLLIAPAGLIDNVYSAETIGQIREHSRLLEPFFDARCLEANRKSLAQAEVIFSTWGMPVLDAEFFALAPKLRAVFYAAGTVKGFVTDEVWKREVTICSAWRANAIPVAEFTLGSILLSLKGVWAYHRRLKAEQTWKKHFETRGGYHSTVGLVSLGAVGWRVVDLLRQFDVDVVAYDPYANIETASEAGVRLVGLPELFEQSDVVSVHTPWLKQTENLIYGDLVRSMKPYTTLINTSRGAVVNEKELLDVLIERPDLTAVLDVCSPEPPEKGSRLYKLPNVLLTPHIAGSEGMECQRMGRYMLDEYLRFFRGKSLQHQVTPDALASLA